MTGVRTTDKYRPTLTALRAAWVNNVTGASYMERLEYEVGFDQWLEDHDREQRAAGWEEGFLDRGPLAWLRNVPSRHSSYHRYQEDEVIL